MKLLSFVLATIILPYAQITSAQVQGPMYQVNVRGLPMNCTSFSRQPVKIFLDDQLNDIGRATGDQYGSPIIVINPNIAGQFSNTVMQWWFAHECAHHALPPQWNTETNADCFGIKQLVQYGIIRQQEQLWAFHRELSSLQGTSNGHLPGILRVQNIVNCALQ